MTKSEAILRSVIDRPIAFNRSFAKVTGSVAGGVFLSQLVYWHFRSSDPDNWIYKTGDEWHEETCLTRREQEVARQVLCDLKILKEERRGLPARLYYRLDIDCLVAKLSEKTGGCVQSSLSHVTNSNVTCDKQYSVSETTTETTKKEPPNPQGGIEGRCSELSGAIDSHAPSSNTSAADKAKRTKQMAKGFTVLKSAYPSHKVKRVADAQRFWMKLTDIDSAKFRLIRAALEWFKASDDWQKDGGQYVPDLAVWINGKRWLDYEEHLYRHVDSASQSSAPSESIAPGLSNATWRPPLLMTQEQKDKIEADEFARRLKNANEMRARKGMPLLGPDGNEIINAE